MNVPIEISARHIHLSEKDLEILFGRDYQLTIFKEVSQPNQFSCQETVTVLGTKGKMGNVRVVGPVRSQTQLEISKTDAYNLGINPQIRVSGDLQGTTGGVKIIGPKNEIDLDCGVIIAQRHLHIEPIKAKQLHLKHGQLISIKTPGKGSITFHNVIVRSQEGKDILACHIDVDEGNAAGVRSGDVGEIVV